MILTGEPIAAEQAQRLGLVNRVVSSAELEDEVERFSGLLLAQSAQVTMLARKAARLASAGDSRKRPTRIGENLS